jgi:hypothetical protein
MMDSQPETNLRNLQKQQKKRLAPHVVRSRSSSLRSTVSRYFFMITPAILLPMSDLVDAYSAVSPSEPRASMSGQEHNMQWMRSTIVRNAYSWSSALQRSPQWVMMASVIIRRQLHCEARIVQVA